MSTKIRVGHASSSENGTATGNAGDSTGKEVRIDEEYDISTREVTVLLRPVSSDLAENSAKACEDACKNDNIGYSQSDRNTLNTQATAINYDLSKITTKCNTDCSAFMTVCAKAGNAKFSYGLDGSSNAPTCSSMRRWFTSTGDYRAYTSADYLKSTDYLQRGDILVFDGHTVMVLDNGSKATVNIGVNSLSLSVKISDVTSTKASIHTGILKTESGIQREVKDEKEVSLCSFSYMLEAANKPQKDNVKESKYISASSQKFNLNNLSPNSFYILVIKATIKDSDVNIYSPSVIFKTPQAFPKPVRNFAAEFDIENMLCKVSFKEPSSWGNAKLKKKYKTSLLVNGRSTIDLDFNTNSVADKISGYIPLTELFETKKFSRGDFIQVSIQPGLVDSANNFIYDTESLSCSQPFFVEPFLNIIDKIFLNVNGNFKRALIHNNLTEV